jgi:hypothetical protein
MELVTQKTISLVNLDALPDDCQVSVLNAVLSKPDFLAAVAKGLGKTVTKHGNRLTDAQRKALQSAPKGRSDADLAAEFGTTQQTVNRYRKSSK